MKIFGVLGVMLAQMCVCCAESLIDVDFSAAGEIAKYPLAQERVKGELPKGWSDDSSFAQSWVEYSFGDEQGTRFLRCHVTRIDSEWAQLSIAPLRDATADQTYRLSVTCRNRSGGDITIGLRQRGQPYTFYWKTVSRFSENWEQREWEFEMPRNDAPMGLWMVFQQTGVFDVARLKLERVSHADLVNEIKERCSDGGPTNLVRATRFALGLPTGWSVSRESSDGDDVTTQVAGGDLAPALRLVAEKTTTLFSAPIELVYPIVPHLASIDARGSGEWRVTVFGPGLELKTKSFFVGDAWQRIELPFAPQVKSRFCQLSFSGAGELFLDKFQVGPEAKSSGSYCAPTACEVAAALAGTYDAGAAKVVFDDERAVIEMALTGDFANSAVHWRIFDIYKTQIAQGMLEAAARLQIKEIPAALGSLRFEARVERDGQGVSPWCEMIWHQLHRPRYWGRDAPDSPFGVHTLAANRHLVMAKAIGINWSRLHDAGLEYCGWWNLEPKQGQWRFFDKEIQRYRTHGIKVFAELGTAPAWASYYQDTGLKSFGYFDKFFQPKNLDDYANYVRVFCERYKGVIDAFDVWNEPWIHAWWGVSYDHTKSGRAGYVTSENAPADFARLTKRAWETVHATLPQALVFGVNTTSSAGNSASSYGGSEWTRGVVAAGGLDHCDGIAYHCYTTAGVGYPGDSVENGLSNAVGAVREQHGRSSKQIWMTEGSPLIYRVGNGLYTHTLPFPNQDEALESADRIARYQISLLANGVSRIFLYSMHSHDGRFQEEPKQWNIFTTDDGALHPSGAAHAQVAWLLEETRFSGRLDLTEGVSAYLFSGQGRAVAAITSTPNFKSFKVPQIKGMQWVDLFGNQLAADAEFTGRVIYLQAVSIQALTSALNGAV
ncbi:MAG: hypothetical protein PHO37_12915 [Kiritimatiellae bacterium]|nr:hypothetical protein [Kiritimatiellia bacterium]